jgi:D-lactate dehydrogenase
MRLIFFSSKPYDREFFAKANAVHGHELVFLESRLTRETAALAKGFPAVCAFVNDRLDAPVLNELASLGVKYLLLRSAGYNHLDRQAAARAGLQAAYVPGYSPHAVAEHTVALMLGLNRKTHRAYARVKEGNFSIEGLLGFDLHGRTVGLVGVGRIGGLVGKIMQGFGCRVLAYDPAPRAALGIENLTLTNLHEVFREADILSLHCPLTPETRHIMNVDTLSRCKPGLMLINTSRGALIDTPAVIDALKSGQVGSLGIDVYEDEAELFYEDFSSRIIKDDVLLRLIAFPNVLITAHQAFFTREALTTIAETTLTSASDFAQSRRPASALPGVSAA